MCWFGSFCGVCLLSTGRGDDDVLYPVLCLQLGRCVGTRADDPGCCSQRLRLKVMVVRQRHVRQNPDLRPGIDRGGDLVRRPTGYQAVGNHCCAAVEHVSEPLPVHGGAANRPIAVDRYCLNVDAEGSQVLRELGVVLVAAGTVPDVPRDQEADVHLLDRELQRVARPGVRVLAEDDVDASECRTVRRVLDLGGHGIGDVLRESLRGGELALKAGCSSRFL